MKHLTLWTWLKAHGLKQQDLATGLTMSVSWVCRRMNRDGFTPEEQAAVLTWARRMRPKAKVQQADLFEPEAA